MHNKFLVALRDYSFLTAQNMTACAPIVQVGDVFFAVKDASTAIVYDESSPVKIRTTTYQEVGAMVAPLANTKACVYVSVAPMVSSLPTASPFAPYFAIVLDLNTLSAGN